MWTGFLNGSARAAIEASADLGKEKGSYPLFEGSGWQTGTYFSRRGYTGKRWKQIAAKAAQGMRNAYLLAIAPTSSTSILSGTTAGIDPIMHRFYLEEKGSHAPKGGPGADSRIILVL